MFNDNLESRVRAVLEHSPEWVRRDLHSENSADRIRAEETLAAMIAADLRGHSATTEPA